MSQTHEICGNRGHSMNQNEKGWWSEIYIFYFTSVQKIRGAIFWRQTRNIQNIKQTKRSQKGGDKSTEHRILTNNKNKREKKQRGRKIPKEKDRRAKGNRKSPQLRQDNKRNRKGSKRKQQRQKEKNQKTSEWKHKQSRKKKKVMQTKKTKQ